PLLFSPLEKAQNGMSISFTAPAPLSYSLLPSFFPFSPSLFSFLSSPSFLPSFPFFPFPSLSSPSLLLFPFSLPPSSS
ncbi:hypothetical protein ACXWR7_13615, partial [Streptococcus pyogenes]